MKDLRDLKASDSIADKLWWVARIVSLALALFNIVYIAFATLMIIAAKEELFPKMTYSFLALAVTTCGLILTLRRKIWWLGAAITIVGWIAYRYAELLRLGYDRGLGIVTYGLILALVLYLAAFLVERFAEGRR